ncbi:MAG: MerR family transcriptional regulator [Ktedonobacteraceae bacterium]|nr:MerR family transcriptional regulator [Ktedonobacteraceae bacterium]
MEKLYVREELLTIQQMAQVSGLSAHTLRYYERAGLMKQHVGRDDANGYRYYTQEDVNWIEFIKRLRATGMPIRDIQRYADLLGQGDHTVSARMQLLKQHRQRVEEHLHEVELHLSSINKKITYYEQQYAQQEVGLGSL